MDEKLREALAAGRDLYRQKEFLRAEPYLAQVAQANVPYADVYNMLGVIYHDMGQFSRAQQCFEEAIKINPAYTEASLNLAVTYNDMGRYADAKELYLGALTSSTRPGGKLDSFVMGKLANMYADIASVFSAAGAFEEAIGEYRRALALRPTFVDLRLKLAEALRDAGRPQDALRELKAILAQNPDYLPARIHHGLTLFSTGDAAAAIGELAQVVADHPENARAKLYLDMIRSHAAKVAGDKNPSA
ncbi:MAG: tetratricopeptide repeat protein [Deltaproteobacteria bacterium]|nr:tetratricopeptide repeat protein [Deltaproteobacteria bacterium]